MVVILPPGGKRAAMPTLLQGYGSYGTLSLAPWYSPYWLRQQPPERGRYACPDCQFSWQMYTF